MITVKKISEGVRWEGLNYGLPTVFLHLGEGLDYRPEELVKEILVKTKCKWVCIYGSNTTQIGMGAVVKGLTSVGFYVEVECTGDTRDPGWLHSVDRWLVDFVPEGSFNYSALRDKDMIRWVIKTEADLAELKTGLDHTKLFTGTKCVKVLGGDDKVAELYRGAFEVIKGYERVRLYALD